MSALTSQEAPAEAYEQPPQRTNENLSAQGARFVSEVAPRTAARAELEIARVLAQAAASYRVEEQQRIVDAARRTWQRNAISSVSALAAPATPLKDAARRAFYTQRNVGNALDLHLQAFGSDPYDPEIAGNLAALYLRLQPSQPYPARHLAMHAMALTSAQTRSPRAQDWTTFATASALIGRADDATHGLFVAAALSRDVGSTCKTALAAVATYGDRMRVPVESMLLRLHEQGRDHDAPFCTFPPRLNYAGRFY